MPMEMYGILYSITDLADQNKMVKDIYAMKSDTTETTAMTSTAPFSTMQTKTASQLTFILASAPFPRFHNFL